MNAEIEALKQQSLTEFKKHKFEIALKGFETCLLFFEQSGDELSIAEMRNNLCVTLIKLKLGDRALELVNKTDEIFARNGDYKSQAMALANTATALESIGRFEEALDKYECALEILKKNNENELRGEILRRISDLQLKTKRGLQAIASIDAAFDQDEKKSIKNSVFKTLLTFIRKRFLRI